MASEAIFLEKPTMAFPPLVEPRGGWWGKGVRRWMRGESGCRGVPGVMGALGVRNGGVEGAGGVPMLPCPPLGIGGRTTLREATVPCSCIFAAHFRPPQKKKHWFKYAHPN